MPLWSEREVPIDAIKILHVKIILPTGNDESCSRVRPLACTPSFLPSVLSSRFLTQLELFLVCYRTSKAVKCSGSSTQVTPIGFFAYVPINSTFIYPIPRL